MNTVFIGAGPGSLGEKVYFATKPNTWSTNPETFKDYPLTIILDRNAKENKFRYDATVPEFASQLGLVLDEYKPELVVNFVGAIDFQMVRDLEFDRFKNNWWTNLMPLMNCAKALANYKEETNFVQIGSNAASYPFTGMFSYSVSKAAQKQAIKIMAKEMAPRIRVNMINPGPMEPSLSHMSRRQIPLIFGNIDEESARDKMIQRIPLKRLCNIDDLTRAIYDLHTNTYMTGQVIELSGGQIL